MFIITGGTHGIGRATAEVLASQGKSVLITGRDEESGAEAARQIPGAEFMRADIADEADCRAVAQRAMVASSGQINGLVNNAGIGKRQKFQSSTLADWDTVMNINARGTYLMTRLTLDGLIAARGAVVNVSSIAGRAGEEELALYTASKAAVIGLTQALALELGHLVRFNAVCPGQIATRMMQAVTADDHRRRTLELRIPAGRLAEPREVGEVIAWLLSDSASYVNGAIIPIDGGETAGLRTPRQLA